MKKASFYDLDGTLASMNILHPYLFYAANAQGIFERARRLVTLAAATPLYWATDKWSRRAFNDLFYASYAGLSEDRIAVLGEELFEEVLRPRVFPEARELVERHSKAGYVTAMVTGTLDFIADRLAAHLGIEHVAANRLVFRNGVATGRVVRPVLAGATKADWIRRFAREHEIDLEGSVAFADSSADLPILCLVGRPHVVNPDARLRQAAKENGWPVLCFGASGNGASRRIALRR